jgi:hypothetical protein
MPASRANQGCAASLTDTRIACWRSDGAGETPVTMKDRTTPWTKTLIVCPTFGATRNAALTGAKSPESGQIWHSTILVIRRDLFCEEI